ncbi:MAG TPA: TonB-dependent receptor [Steroidobacteraceae bacterium]|nr:TonB-dependent receptor [Steroidobacteraceae bacterium]
MHKKNLALIASAMPIGCLFAGQASAAEEQTTVFEPVIVTAQKREQSIYEVPVAISAFTADTIEKQGIADLTDIGKFVPNLNVTGFSAGSVSSVNAFIRGIGLQDHLITTDPGVGVYVDGVYLGRQVGQNWSLANIERVEVLRGPQGTLYGRNSIGGAINIITRQPGDEEGGRLSFTAGSRGRLNADFYTNMPFSEQFALSLTGAFQHRDGLGHFVELENPRKEVGEMEDVSARVAAKWSPNDKLSFLLAADGNDGDGGLRPYDTLINQIGAACRENPPNGDPSQCINGALYDSGYRNSDTSSNPYNNNTGQESQTEVTNEARGVSLTVDYAIADNMAAKLILSDRHSEYKAGLDDDGMFVDEASFPEKGEADQQSAELQLTGDAGPWDYVAGLYWFTEDGKNSQDPAVFLQDPGDFLLEQSTDSQAVYVNVGYHFTDDLRVSGGLRYTEDSKTAHTNLSIINKTLRLDETNSRDWSDTSWDLSANYQLNDRMHVYGTIQSGYQSGQFPPRPYCLLGSFFGGFDPLSSDPNYCFVANDNVTATNYEVGLKGQPLDSLQMSIAAFYTEYSNLPYQVSVATTGGFNTVNIIVDQKSQGLEWESTWAPIDNFRLYATVGYIDTDVNGANPDTVAPLTPELTASVSPEYTLPVADGRVTMRLDYSFRDDMYGEPTSNPARFTAIDSRDLLNFDITYEPNAGGWTVSAYGKNVTDERYDNARLNTGTYILVIKSIDASEFGVRFTKSF